MALVIQAGMTTPEAIRLGASAATNLRIRELLHLAALRLDAVGDAGKDRLALFLLLDQAAAFALLVFFNLGQFRGLVMRQAGEMLFLLENSAEVADQPCLGVRQQAKVVGVAGQLVGVVAGEQVAQGIGLAGVILPGKQPAQLGLLYGNA